VPIFIFTTTIHGRRKPQHNMKVRLAWLVGISTILLSDAYSLLAKPPGKNIAKDRLRLGPRPSQREALSATNKNNIEFRPDLLSLRGGDASPAALVSKALFREMIAELIGTFLIVFVGTGSVFSAIFTDSLVGLFQIAAVWIIAVTIAICCTASISGAHLNPAISIAFAMIRPSKSFNWKKVIPYSISQYVGAILGSCVNLVLYGSSIAAFESKNGIVRGTASGLQSAKAFGEYFSHPVTTTTAFLVESIGTAILAFVIFALTHPKNDTMESGFVPPLIGLTVGGLICVCAPLTQAGFNPARDFGPRIVAWLAGWKTVAFQSAWLYIVAPIVGAVFGAALADRILFAE